ncbi:type IV secretory system conjugative DNA transfer family protein [Nocardia jiangxiensis]|uniref:type IV secretory system conjugative DNA transfer family protein n=1 Tax=Nocardia jiangxiensis TaxID=282685 RepID=UPI0002EDD280|nr:TraM recognition domain-containing protein [Nocardia jiangxiensis]
MARQTRRRTTGALGEETWLLLASLAVAGLVVLAWIALSLGSWCAGLPVVANPLIAVLEVILGRHRWPWQASAIGAVIATAATVFTLYARHRWPRRSGIDAAARTMDPPAAITLARRQDNAIAAKRLLKDAPKKVRTMAGPPLGSTVIGGIELFLPAEQSLVIAAGQRTGKTMAWAIPAVLSAWGPVLATSNRPDLYQHTVAGAEERGTVWMCDLQAVTGTPQCGFWVNLLAQVHNLPAARKLAAFFVSAASGSATERSGAKVDSYFDGGAQELLGLHMFAAACIGGDLLHVSEWLSADQDQTPALILRAKGHLVPARRILDAQSLYARQRDGLYDMARRFLNTLSDEGYAQMVTPPSRTRFTVYEGADGIVIDTAADPTTHRLPEFQPAQFVTSTDTLYALSIAGPDSAGALTAALVGQILEAALKIARSRRGGRLAVPLLAVLEEAANCARIDELPSYYTYAAGSGVILVTILQVIEQGEDLWSVNGLRTMRAQSIEIFGGNIANDSYLEQWARLIDDHDVADYSRSVGPGGVNRTTSWRAEPVLNIAKLNKLPRDRALIRLPGHEPILIKKHFWWDNPDLAPIITDSLKRFNNDPAGTTIGSPPQDESPSGTKGTEL